MLKKTPKKRVLFVRRAFPALLALFGVFSYLILNLHSPTLAYASSADTVNFQSRLQTSSGAIVPDGYYNVEFKLYSASTSGSALWTEDYTSTSGPGATDARLEVKDGYLSTALGSITPFGTGIDWSQQLYLTMNIGGTGTGVVPTATSTSGWDGEMSPRLALTSTPYAFQAGQAAQANELSTVSGSNTSTLSIQGSTSGNQAFVIQDQGAGGTYDVLTAPAGSDGYIKLQTGTLTQQIGDIDVSGAATVGSVDTSSLDTASAGAIAIGGTNATSIALGNMSSNIATTINGTALVKSTSGNNSTIAFQVQNSTGATVLSVDTTDQQVSADQNSSSTMSPIMSLIQNGSSSSTLALQNSTTSSAFYLSDNVSNSNAFTINSYTAATTTSMATPMEVQFNSTATSGSASSTSVTFGSNNTAGNTIVVAAQWYSTGLTPTCTDTQGNTYSTIVTVTNTSVGTQSGICYATNIKAGANTVTVTYGTPLSYRSLAIVEYSGIAATSPVDTYATNFGTGTTSTNGYTSTSATTTTSGDLVFGFIADLAGTSATATPGTGFAQRTNNTGYGSPVLTEDEVQSTAGSIAATDTETQAHAYTGMMMAFKASTTGALTNTNSNALFSLSQSGQTTLKNSANSTSAFQVQDASGTNILNVDTTDSCVNIGAINCATSGYGGYGDGLSVISTVPDGGGVYGENDTAGGYGVEGHASGGSDAIGVYGEDTSSDSSGSGVAGSSVNGTGVSAGSTNGYGLSAGSANQSSAYLKSTSAGNGTPTLLIQQEGDSTASLLQIQDSTGSDDLLNVASDGSTTIQDSSGDTVFNANTNSGGTVTVTNNVSTASSAITSQTSGWEWNNNTNGITTLSTVSPHTVGDLMMFVYDAGGSGNVVTSIAGGGVTSWQYVTTSGNQYVYEGTVTSTGTSPITIGYSGGSPSAWGEMTAQEFSSAYGTSTVWNVVTSGLDSDTSSASVPFPSLTTTQANQLYWGYAGISGTLRTSPSGCPSGYSCVPTAAGDFTTYNASTAANTAYAPTATQSSSSPGDSSTLGVIMLASPASGTALAVNGSAIVAASSTTALQVQNALGASLLDVDTSGGNVYLGATGSTALNSNVYIGTSTSAVQTVTIGSSSGDVSNAVAISGGTGSAAVSLQAASNGTISIGTSNTNTVDVGAVGTTAVTSTVNIATSTGAAQAVTLGSTDSSSTTTIQGGTGNVNVLSGSGSINLGQISVSTGTLGYTGIGTNTDGADAANGLTASTFTTTAGGTIGSMSTYISSPLASGDSYQFAIYTNNSGVPGSYIASSAIGTTTASGGWYTLPISATLAPTTTYWLVYWSESADGTNYNSGVTGDEVYANTYSWQGGTDNGFPGTFPTSGNTTFSTVQASIYATFVSGVQPIVSVSSTGGLNVAGSAAFQDISNSTTAFQILQSGTGGAALLTADTSNLIITIAGTTTNFGTLNIDNAHFESVQTTAPTIGSVSSCGSGTTAATQGITSGSTDSAGSFYVQTGSTASGVTCQVTVTFNKAYGSTPKMIVLTPDNSLGGTAPTASVLGTVSAKATSSFTFKMGATTSLTTTRFGYDYWVVE